MPKTISELAKEACEVQDACNLVAVVGGMHRALQCLMQEHNVFGDALRQHPVARAWADKVASLVGIQDLGNDNAMAAHEACTKLAARLVEAEQQAAQWAQPLNPL